jgi:rfaE bifunctional protein kinase chain/domain
LELEKKIIKTKSQLLQLRALIEGNKAVLCHGHFNVIHPGHMRFLKHAHDLGEKLVVAVASDSMLLENSERNFFSETERVNCVAALYYVSFVVLLDEISLKELICEIRPVAYVMGKEFEDERADEIREYVDLVKQNGGGVFFHSGDIHYSNTDLLHYNTNFIQKEKADKLKKVCFQNKINIENIKEKISLFKDLNLLVMGDTIVDQFVACDSLGMSSEAPVLVLKEIEAKEFLGGAAIVASHIRSLGARCHFCSVIGQDQPGEFAINTLKAQKVEPHLFIDPNRPTTFKIRYIAGNQKILRVSRLKDNSIPKEIELKIIQKLDRLIRQVDGIIISDFVYGVITPRILKHVTKIAKEHDVLLFGDLQCSSQIGNVTKFQHFDLICPTEKEARIALADQESGLEKLARNLIEQTQTSNLMITLGEKGFVSFPAHGNESLIPSQHFPALVSNPVDVAGAGDALLAAVALMQSSGASLIESSVLGACMAAIAVNRMGNVSISQQELHEFLDNI